MHDAIPDLPCSSCPWRFASPRFVWPTERFNDFRLERLTSGPSKAVLACLCCFVPHNGICKTLDLPRVEMRPASTALPLGSSIGAKEIFFPSFEAMADANGAGLYDWTKQLNAGDLVVHFLGGIAIGVLEVLSVRNGVVQASTKTLTYFFNALGYEMKCTSDSRILPATRATLETFVLQPDASESQQFL